MDYILDSDYLHCTDCNVPAVEELLCHEDPKDCVLSMWDPKCDIKYRGLSLDRSIDRAVRNSYGVRGLLYNKVFTFYPYYY